MSVDERRLLTPCVGSICNKVSIYSDCAPTLPDAATSSRITASHPNSKVKLDRDQVVLRWGTTREGWLPHLFALDLDTTILRSQRRKIHMTQGPVSSLCKLARTQPHHCIRPYYPALPPRRHPCHRSREALEARHVHRPSLSLQCKRRPTMCRVAVRASSW